MQWGRCKLLTTDWVQHSGHIKYALKLQRISRCWPLHYLLYLQYVSRPPCWAVVSGHRVVIYIGVALGDIVKIFQLQQLNWLLLCSSLLQISRDSLVSALNMTSPDHHYYQSNVLANGNLCLVCQRLCWLYCLCSTCLLYLYLSTVLLHSRRHEGCLAGCFITYLPASASSELYICIAAFISSAMIYSTCVCSLDCTADLHRQLI